METLRKAKPSLNGKHAHDAHHAKVELDKTKETVKEAISDLWIEGKKFASEWCEDGMQRIHETEQEVEKYADKVTAHIKENPLKAVLIAGGIGFLFGALFKK